jgi:hypothetical protein
MGLFDFLKSESDNSKIDFSDFKFISNDHVRYQNGQDVSGHNYDCWRGIRIQKNISGEQGHTVTIYNLDGNHPVWGNNVQMAPKQMKITEQTLSSIRFKGFGYDSMGASFADYGLTLHLEDNHVESVSLHMFDRNIEIIYYKNAVIERSSNNLNTLFLLSDTINNSNENSLILKKSIELKTLVLENRQIFEIETTKELYDAMEKSYKALLKAIPLEKNPDERYSLVVATYFILSKYRIISPGNGNVCEDKIKLMLNYKSQIEKLFQVLENKAGTAKDSSLSYELVLYYLLGDNRFMLDYNPDLKEIYNQFHKKYSSNSDAIEIGKTEEKKYFDLMFK